MATAEASVASDAAGAVAATPAHAGERTVKLGDTVIVEANDGDRFFALVAPDQRLSLHKMRFNATALIGARHGTVFEIGDRGVLTEVEELIPEIDLTVESSGADNRNLVANQSNQAIDAHGIAQLKAGGVGGAAIVAALIENSSTFAQKTKFSQEKYIKRKAAKYIHRVRVLLPDARSVCSLMHATKPDKLLHLRYDALALLLLHANLEAGRRVMVCDSTGGVVLGAVGERMGWEGTFIVPHEAIRPYPHLANLQKFNPPVASFAKKVVGTSYKLMADCTRDAQAVIKALIEEQEGAAGVPPITTLALVGGGSAAMAAAAASGSSEDGGAVAGHKRSRAEMEAGSGGAEEAGAAAEADGSEDEDGGEEEEGVDGESATGAAASSSAGGGGAGAPRPPRVKLPRSQRQPRNAAAVVHAWRPATGITNAHRQRALFSGAHSLVVASQYDPTTEVLSALRFCLPSASLAVFCSEAGPLAQLEQRLRRLGMLCYSQLNEVWRREIQVLPMRTHPTMSMHGASGYVLTGTVLASPYGLTHPAVQPL